MGKRKFESRRDDTGGNSKQAREAEPAETGDAMETSKNMQHEDAASEFNVKHFRKELNAKQGQTIALTQFLQMCINPDSQQDYMLQYLKSGGNSHEILRQISTDSKKNLTLATPAFHIFHLIIMKVQATMPHMIAITEEACRYFLNTFMPTVEIMISEHSGPRHRKIVLKLFTSMVTLNPDLGVEILNQAPLTPKHLQYIVEKPNYREKDNVRTAFVHFVTSFLIEGHLPLIKALLDKQGLLSLIIPGLIQDEGESVIMFLNILKTNVVENININKSLKLKTFSHIVLHNLFKVYNWKGPPEREPATKSEIQFTIASLLSEIILTLFTSHKLGLYFIDKSLGTSDAHKNQNLYNALLSLKRPWENRRQCEVIVQIVDKCPDLHRALITVIEQSFEPQNTAIWRNSAEFVITLLNRIQPHDILTRMSNLSPIQVTNFIRFTTLPIPLLKLLKQGITKEDMFITAQCVKVIVTMLSAVKKYLDSVKETKTMVADLFKNRLEGFIPKHLPTPDTIISSIQDVMKTETLKANTESLVDISTILINNLDFLIMLNEVHPASLEGIEGHLDMKAVLDYAESLNSENVLLLKFKVVTLWLSLDPTVISLQKPMFCHLFQIIIQVYSHDDDTISSESTSTLRKFLKMTSIFDGDEGEIDIVLYALKKTKVEPASLLVEVVLFGITNAEELRDIIRKKVDISGLITNEDSAIDKLLDELSSEIQNINNNIFIDGKMPSPLLLACLKFAKESKTKRDSLKAFLSVYAVNLLHYCTSPELMTALIIPYKCEAKEYVSTWSEMPIMLNEELAQNDEIIHKLARYIIDANDSGFDEIFPHFEIVPEEMCDRKVRDLTLKWELQVKVDSSELLAWANFLVYSLLQLTKLDLLTDFVVEKIRKCLDGVLAIAKYNKLPEISRKILYNILTNPLMLTFYSPVEKSKNPAQKSITKFVIGIIEHYGEDLLNLHLKTKVMKPYQHKNFLDLKKIINKISKKKTTNDDDHTVNVLEKVGMTNADTKEIVSQLLSLDIKCAVTENNEPSLIINVLGLILANASTHDDMEAGFIPKVFEFYTKILKDPEINVSLVAFESILKDFFEKQSQHVKLINKASFKNFFSSKVVRKSTSQLASVLLQRNVQLCDAYKEEIQNPDVIGQRELVLPLSEAIVTHTKFVDENQPLLEKLFAEYKSSIVKVLEKPHKVGRIYNSSWRFIRKLIYECMPVEECAKFFEKSHKFEAVEEFHIHLVQTAFLKVCVCSDSHKMEHHLNYFTMMLGLLTAALKSGVQIELLKVIISNVSDVARITKGTNAFEINKEGFTKLIENSVWQNFCKAALKDSLKIKTSNETETIGPRLLSLLSTMVEILYPCNHSDIMSLFEMVTSHSEFLNVILSHHSVDIKSRLIDFLYVLILRNKAAMKPQHIPVYLSAYHATEAPNDRLLLKLLHFYETNGQSVNEYKPYVWGDSGANYYAVRKNRTSSLWSHPTPNQILNLLDRETIENTVTNFPVNQRLDYKYEMPAIDEIEGYTILIEQMKADQVFRSTKGNNVSSRVNSLLLRIKYEKSVNKMKEIELSSSSHKEGDNNIYDPAFLLPILSHLLAPGSVVSCFKIVRSGLLGLPLAALSSHCPDMRAAGYHVLHRFCQQLETETKHRNDKMFLADVVDTLRQSLSTAIVTAQKDKDAIEDLKNPRFPAVASVYLARAISVATAPFDPMYKPVNNFLIAKQQIDLTVVPDFLSLFHDCDVESTDIRIWILNAMRDGVKTMSDVNVVFKTMAPKMAMDFHSSVLADKKTKCAILQFLTALVSVPRAADIMIEGYGLMSWLSGVVRDLDDKSVVSSSIHLINGLCRSLNVNAFSKMLNGLRKVEDKKATEKICGKDRDDIDVTAFGEIKLNREVEYQIVYLLVALLPHIDSLSAVDHAAYLNALNAVSKKCLKVLNKNQIISLTKNCTEGFERDQAVESLRKAISLGDAGILKLEVLSTPVDNFDEYAARMDVLKILRSIVIKYVS